MLVGGYIRQPNDCVVVIGPLTHACPVWSAQETDTQVGIWRDRRAKEMIISFRGTQVSWKDFLTDMLIMQEPLEASGPARKKSDTRLVHAGFRRAFGSVREAVHQAIGFVSRGDLTGWTIDCTGHSLGVSDPVRFVEGVRWVRYGSRLLRVRTEAVPLAPDACEPASGLTHVLHCHRVHLRSSWLMIWTSATPNSPAPSASTCTPSVRPGLGTLSSAATTTSASETSPTGS